MNAPSARAIPNEVDPRGADQPSAKGGRIGVLLVNLGTPEATDYWSMRRYLKEFLSDRRVIETPRLLWWPALNLVILSRRPQRKGLNYAAIWNKELDESPLKTITRASADKLREALAKGGSEGARRCLVDWAMRYGRPAIANRLAALRAEGSERILLVPLYPQYCAATTASVCDKAFDALKSMRWQPTLRVAPPYYDDPVYVEAISRSTRRAIAALDFEPEVILVSFHGVPQSYVDKGDPYYRHCCETWRLLREAMDLEADRMPMAFQSRFGPTEYLKPYTDDTVRSLAAKGVKRLAVVTPGFAADCLETLEEIGIENAQLFRESGGEKFAAVPCLNDTADGMRVIEALVLRELQGWI